MNKHQKYPRFLLMLGLLSVFALFMVACNSADADTAQEYQVALPAIESNPPAEDQANTADTPSDAQADGATDAYPAPAIEPSVQDAATASEAYPALDDLVNEPVEAPAPIQRTELEATNPATVSLASGNLQLVELFAFW